MKKNVKNGGLLSLAVASVVAATSVPSVAVAAGGFSLEEVIVTARKRDESVQDAPLSVSAFSQKDLDHRNITATSQLGEVTPGLSFDANAPVSGSSASSQIFIRGIGQTDFTAVTDPGVGLYVDGVYLARSMGGAMGFLELEQVEVLKGPQGTLFGRNTIGGAVLLRTARPASEFGGKVKVQVGNDDMFNVTSSIDVPLSDNLFSKITLASAKRDGYVERITDGTDLGNDETLTARARLLWEASDDFTLEFITDYTKENENGSPSVSRGLNDQSTFPHLNNILVNNDCPLFGPPAPPGPGRDTANHPSCLNYSRDLGPYKSGGTGEVKSDFENYGFTLLADWYVSDSFSIKSITGYRDIDSYSARDADNTEQRVFHTQDIFLQDQFSQEFQFSGDALEGSLEWLVGLYYFEESAENPNSVQLNPGVQGEFLSGGLVENDSYSVFSQATYSVTDSLYVTAGLRYNDETKRFSPFSYTRPGEIYVGPNGTLGVGDTSLPHGPNRLVPEGWVEQSYDDVSSMLNVSYDFTHETMAYINYAEGYKSGGFDQRFNGIFDEVSQFSPETADAYEVGIKTSLLDNTLRVNAAAFYTDYQDLQFIVRRGFAPVTLNAGEAEIKGVEVEMTYVPNESWLVQLGLGYMDAEYKEISDAVFAPGINSEVTIDDKLAKTPELTASLGIAYNISTDRGLVTPRIDVNYTDDVFHDAPNLELVSQEAYAIVHASIAFASADGKWEVVLAGRNLTDEQYITGGTDGTTGATGYSEVNYARPREWSLSAEYNF